ncbi:MAG: hypothetical protein H7707_03070 [Acetobacter sp.]|nr:hypothetical protein [Acetobacter sp.]
MVVVCGFLVVASPKSYALLGVTLVHDTQGDQEKAVSLTIQGAQKALQGLQYAKELQNLLTIGAFIWTMANAIYQQVQDLDNVQSYYQIVYGGIEDYLKDSQDIYAFYNDKDKCSSLYPAFTHVINDYLKNNYGKNYEICTKKTFQKQQNASTVQTKLNTSETQLIAKQQQDLPSESARITTIQNQPETGALQALQVETQLLDKIIDELRKLRTVTLAQNAAEAHKREQETQDRARAAVYLHQVYETQGVIYMKSREWR